ncbi:Hypothetical predicted protein [Mytilus galloprovincialis]|uniref:Uncharacterized protein n=1 Tax=Mytilus galloprovincialis TaxID=29158 RepID=A0A8B6H4Y2_MYTGA|nr:Hypothetical predicted protein [Mytilus galloprovincialis]
MENIMLLSSLIAGSTERDRLVIGQQMGIHTFRDKQRIFASKKKTDPGNVCPPKSTLYSPYNKQLFCLQ